MTIDEVIESADPVCAEKPDEPYSASWWQGRSPEELRGFLDRGFGSATFDGATAEAERRGRQQMRIEEATAHSVASRKKSLRLGMLEALLLGCLVALIAILLIR